MRRNKIVLLSLIIVFILSSCASQSQSTKGTSSVYEAQPENITTIRSTPVTPGEIKSIKRIAIFISGAEASYTTMMEDALSIDLQNLGFQVVSRSEIKKRVTKELKDLVSKWKEEWKEWYSLPDSIKFRTPEPIVDETKISRDEVEIGKLVGADAVLTGTILEGRQQYSNMKEGSGAGAEKIVITAISLQLIDVKKEKVLVEVLIGYTHGVSIPYVSEDVADFLSEKMK